MTDHQKKTQNVVAVPNDNEFDLISADNNISLTQLSSYRDLRRNIKSNTPTRIFLESDDHFDNLPPTFDLILTRSLLDYDEIIWVCYTFSVDFDKFKKIVLNKNHDISNTETFRKLVSTLKKLPNHMFRLKHEALYQCHIEKLPIIQQLLNASLEKINKSKNHIIHFMVFLNVLFREFFDIDKLLKIRVYDMFVEFSYFIRMCLFYKNKVNVEWLPEVWNNCFYYSCFLVEKILFNHNGKLFTFVDWSTVPDIKSLIKILLYNNQKRLSRIAHREYLEHHNNSLEQHSLNIIEYTLSDSNNKNEEPPIKKITLAEYWDRKRHEQKVDIMNQCEIGDTSLTLSDGDSIIDANSNKSSLISENNDQFDNISPNHVQKLSTSVQECTINNESEESPIKKIALAEYWDKKKHAQKLDIMNQSEIGSNNLTLSDGDSKSDIDSNEAIYLILPNDDSSTDIDSNEAIYLTLSNDDSSTDIDSNEVIYLTLSNDDSTSEIDSNEAIYLILPNDDSSTDIDSNEVIYLTLSNDDSTSEIDSNEAIYLILPNDDSSTDIDSNEVIDLTLSNDDSTINIYSNEIIDLTLSIDDSFSNINSNEVIDLTLSNDESNK